MIPSPVSEYYIAYKENVVKKFVNAYDENLFYVSNGTIPEKEYYSAGFETGSNVYLHKGRQSQISPEHKKIEMDSTEFEKYFDVYADDKIQAMQVLTSDVMEEMMEFIKESKIKFEFTIKKDKFYIRFWTDEMFEGNILKSSVEFDTLKKVFDVINFTFDITRKIIKVTEETTI